MEEESRKKRKGGTGGDLPFMSLAKSHAGGQTQKKNHLTDHQGKDTIVAFFKRGERRE